MSSVDMASAKPGLLFILSTLGVGGSESKVVRIANALAQTGTPVDVAYLNPPHTLRDNIDATVSVTHLERRGKYSIKSMLALWRLMEERRPHVAIAVNEYPLLYAAPAAGRVRSHDVRTVCLVNTVQLIGFERVKALVYAPLLRRCDRVIFGCEAQKQQWIENYSLPPARSCHIYNGVDHELFSHREFAAQAVVSRHSLGIPRDAFVVGSVGRLAPEKNFDLLLDVVATLNARGGNAYLMLVGQGPEARQLQAIAARLGISDKVTLLGLQRDVRAFLSLMDVFVLPSRSVETFSNAALEAMAMERPVVLSNIGGAAEMIESGTSGFIFDIGDRGRLLSILESLHQSPELRAQLGSAARQRVVDRFQFGDMVKAYAALARL